MTRVSRRLTLAAIAAGTVGPAGTASAATGWSILPPPAAADTNNVINTAWTVSPSPMAPDTYSQVSSLASSPGHVWALGADASSRPLIVSHP